MCENAHGATTRAQSLEAPAADAQIQQACAVEMHFHDFERHECTVSSSESAAHARAAHQSKHSCYSTSVRTPSVSTLLGEKGRWRSSNQSIQEPVQPPFFDAPSITRSHHLLLLLLSWTCDMCHIIVEESSLVLALSGLVHDSGLYLYANFPHCFHCCTSATLAAFAPRVC